MDKGIRQKSTKEWTHSLTAVLFVRGHRSVFPRPPRNTSVYTRHPTFVTATSGVLTRLLKKWNACLHAVRQAVETFFCVYTASEAKGLIKHSWETAVRLLEEWMSAIARHSLIATLPSVLTYLCASAETSWVQIGEYVQADGSGQLPGEVLTYHRQFTYHNLLDKLQLSQSAPVRYVNDGRPALAVCPPVKLWTESFKRFSGIASVGSVRGEPGFSGRGRDFYRPLCFSLLGLWARGGVVAHKTGRGTYC